MTSGVPWEVEGIPQEAREAALQAARRRGMSVGEWLDSVINDRAGGEGERLPRAGERTAPERRAEAEDIAEVKGRLAEVGRQLDQLSRLNTQSYLRPNLRPDEHPHELADAIWKLDRRLDQLVGAPGAPAGVRAAASADPSTPLEQALKEIAERQRALDGDAGPPAAPSPRADVLPRAPTQELSNLEEQLRQVTTRIETLWPGRVDEVVDTLRDDLAEIGLMVKGAAPRQAIEALEFEIRKISERLEASGQNQAGDAAVASIERGLAEVRDALRALTPAENLVGVDQTVRELSRKIDLINFGSQDPAAMQQLESAIVGLRGIASQVASDGALTKLADEVRELAGRVDRIAGSAELLSRLEQRISSLSAALEHRPAPSAVHGDLDTVVRSLSDRIEQLGSVRADHAAPSDLGERISALAEKLDSSNARLDHLEPIERALADLIVQLERVGSTERPAVVAPSPEVNSLREDVRDTRSSLESMRGALEHLIDRMAGIENDIRSARTAPAIPLLAQQPAAAAPSAKAAASGPAATSAPIKAVEIAAAIATSVAAAQSPAAAVPHENRAIDPSLPPDHPLEPGALRARAASPSERIAASEAALGSAKPADTPDPGSKASFIAAARRAAQAANSESGARPEKVAPAAVKKIQAKDKTKAATGRWGGRVRSVLVAASVVAIVLGSLHLVASLFQSADEQGQGSHEIQSAPVEGAPAPQPSEVTPPGTRAPSPSPGRQSLNVPADGGTGQAAPAPDPAPGTTLTGGSEKDITGSIDRPVALTVPAELAAPVHALTNASVDKLPPTIGAVLRAAAAKGDPAAEFEIGLRLAEGRGVTQNLPAAADWFELAAKQGLAPAQFRLGGFYEKGFGVKRDLDTARRLYAAAADAGNAKAMHNLAVLYAEGIDGKPDYQSAATWFRKAADYGLTDSQYNLGILYGRGIGMPVNLSEAYKWFALAARDGDREATAKRDEVAARLDEPSLTAAKAAAAAFAAMEQPETAIQPAAPPGGWDAAAPPAASSTPHHATAKLDHPATPTVR